MTTRPAILPAAHRDDWLLVGIGVAVFAVVLFTVCRPWDLENAFMIGAPFGRDFANFWLGGRLAVTGQLDLLIDLPAYNDLFSTTFHHNPDERFVFSYPPHILLLLAPFAWLPYVPAVTLWTGLNLYGIAQATRLMNWEWGWAGIACLSPAVLTMVAFGHFGGLLAFLATYRSDSGPDAAGAVGALPRADQREAAVCRGVWAVPAGHRRLARRAVVGAGGARACGTVGRGVRHQAVGEFRRMDGAVPRRPVVELPDRGAAHGSVRLCRRADGRPAVLAGRDRPSRLCGGDLVAGGRSVQPPRTDTARPSRSSLFAALAALPYFNSYDLAIMAPAMTLALFDRHTSDAPALSFVPALLLWVAPAFALPFGLLAWPIVPGILAAVLLLALFGGPAAAAGVGRVTPPATAPPAKGAAAP